jgi:hypothetical protein
MDDELKALCKRVHHDLGAAVFERARERAFSVTIARLGWSSSSGKFTPPPLAELYEDLRRELLRLLTAQLNGSPMWCRCNLGWICEEHPDQAWSHDNCAGPSVPCPVCNTQSPPRLQPGRQTIVKVDDEKGGE